MAKAQLPDFDDGVLPTAFVSPDQAGRLSRMLELNLEQAAQVAGGLNMQATATSINLYKVRLCRIIACRVLCRVTCAVSCMVATPTTIG